MHPVPLGEIKMPKQVTPFTDLQDLTPLPTTALQDEKYEQLYSNIDTFNPVQTQLFHVLYHSDTPVLLGAPTGSGKIRLRQDPCLSEQLLLTSCYRHYLISLVFSHSNDLQVKLTLQSSRFCE